MIHQKQDRELNCGQTCVSMITGVHIREIEKRMGKTGKTRTTDLRFALQHYGHTIPKSTLTRLKGWSVLLPSLCIVKFKHVKGSESHWVVYKDGVFYDSVQGEAKVFIAYYEEVKLHLKPTSYMEIIR